jgi:glycosyltransferase involved in cell wall biosynthesis
MVALLTLRRSVEVIFVDDGSTDGSFGELRRIAAAEPCVRVIRFRRNFGQTAALQAGIEYSRGETVVFMDADLQNDPADIGRLLAKLEEGYDVVSGWRAHRQDSVFTRTIPSRFANGLISKVTGVRLHD